MRNPSAHPHCPALFLIAPALLLLACSKGGPTNTAPVVAEAGQAAVAPTPIGEARPVVPQAVRNMMLHGVKEKRAAFAWAIRYAEQQMNAHCDTCMHGKETANEKVEAREQAAEFARTVLDAPEEFATFWSREPQGTGEGAGANGSAYEGSTAATALAAKWLAHYGTHQRQWPHRTERPKWVRAGEFASLERMAEPALAVR